MADEMQEQTLFDVASLFESTAMFRRVQRYNMVEIKIGLEIHCQLTGLQSKLFCPC